MDKKQYITEQELRSYFKANGIDEKQLFSYHRLTQEGDRQLQEVIKHFTGASFEGGSITLELGEGMKIMSGEFEEGFYLKESTDNMYSLLESMNKVIDFRNFCVEKIQPTREFYDGMSPEQKEKVEGVMKSAQAKIDALNALERPLEIRDFREETIEPILEMRRVSREISGRGDREWEAKREFALDHYELKTRIEAFLKVRGWDFDKLFDQKRSYKQRKEKMNEVLREFAYTYVDEHNNIIALDQSGRDHKVTSDVLFSLKDIKGPDHFVYMTNGFRENRDLSFCIASAFVRNNKPIEKEAVERIIKENWGISLDDVVEGRGRFADKVSRIEALNEIHFYLTEVYQDKDIDLVTPYSKDESIIMKLTGIGDPATYYDSIDSVDTFIEKAKKARLVRDVLNANQERLSEFVNEKAERLNKDKGGGELER